LEDLESEEVEFKLTKIVLVKEFKRGINRVMQRKLIEAERPPTRIE